MVMKRIISILLFFVVVLSSIVFLTKTANAYEDAGKRIRIIKQAQDKYKKLLLPGHTSNLKDAGCGLFSIAHAMQWLSEKKLTEDEELQLMKKIVDWKFDTAPNDYSKNKGNYRGMANCLSALTKKDTTLVYHKGALNKKNLTESKVKEIFDQGGVIITLQTHHWVCAVGYRYDDKGKLYIQIVDSSAVSTIEPRSGWNLHKGYKYDSLNEIKKSDDNSGGKQYWIPFNCYCGKCNHQRGFIDWYWLSGYSSTLGGPKCKDVSLYALSLKEIKK